MEFTILKKLILIQVILFYLFQTNIYSTEIIVSKTGSITTINQAIQLAQDGDKIVIKKGEYVERNLLVNKSVEIRGESFPVVDSKGDGEIFTVTSNNVQISGLVIKNSGISYLQENAGIRLEAVSGCIITNNKLVNNFFAIYLAKSANCIISNNYIEGEKKRNEFRKWNSPLVLQRHNN